MTEICRNNVVSASLISENYLRLTLEYPVDEKLFDEPLVIDDITKHPELYIHGCVCGNNRPRGFLPATWRKTVIEDNTFYNMYHALHFAGDANDWFESGRVTDVTVKNNCFKNSAYAGGPVILINPHVLRGNTPYHKNILIEGNTFTLAERRFISASFVEGLVFKDNKFIEDKSLPAHSEIGDFGILTKDCQDSYTERPEEI